LSSRYIKKIYIGGPCGVWSRIRPARATRRPGSRPVRPRARADRERPILRRRTRDPRRTRMSATAPQDATAQSAAVRPVQRSLPEDELADLQRRIKATRWPERETVPDDSQGVPLAMIQKVASYWGESYHWSRCDALLSPLPNFVTEIDGLDIHFIHVRSKHEG